MILEITNKLKRVGMKDNQIFEILELMIDENNNFNKLYKQQTLKDAVNRVYDEIIIGFFDYKNDYSLKNILLSEKNDFADKLYNYFMFRLSKDTTLKF